jgi:hypothetical protein
LHFALRLPSPLFITENQGNYPEIMNLGGLTTPRRQAFFCLLTFLAYLLLPQAHQWDLASQARGCPCHSHLAGETAGINMVSIPPAPGESRHQHHDRSTCPLCQAALGPVKLAITSGIAILPETQSGQQVRVPEPVTIHSSDDYFLFAPRAPPSPF